MLRDILTHKWILAGPAFLIVLSITCVWWSHYDTAPYKREAAKSAEFARQWKAAQKTDSKAEQAAKAPAENSDTTAERPTNKIGEGTETNTDKSTEPVNIATPETDNTEEVKVSPFGFGPYPEVPADYPGDYGRPEVDWDLRFSPGKELLSRVLVKLWTEGERNFRGGSTYKGKVYPHYYDTVYIRIEETETGRSIRRKSGPFVDFSLDDIDDPPAHIRILDLETSGIDPYQYLNLR